MALVDGVVGSWHCDDNAANTTVVDDFSTNDLTASTNTSNLSATGIINTSLDFDGSSEEANGSFSKTFDDAFSCSFWMAWDDQASPSTQVIMESQTSARGLIFLGNNTQPTMSVRLDNAGVTKHFTSAVPDTALHHYLVTYDGTNCRIYRDGSELGSSPQSVSWGSFAFTSLYLASRAGSSLFLDGRLDEIVLFDTVKTGTEASELYNSGSGLAYPFTTGTNMQINIGDVWKDVDSLQINIGDVWKDVVSVQQNIGDVWKDVY